MVDRSLLKLIAKHEKFTLADYGELEKELSRLFPKEMDLLEQMGIHPSHRKFGTNFYTGKRDREDYRNIGQHSMVVAFACYIIGQGLALSQSELVEVVSLGLIHDLSKKMELMRIKAVASGTKLPDPFSFEAYHLLEEILTKAGFPPDTIRYVSLAKKTGHIGVANFLHLKDGEIGIKEAPLPDFILQLADDYSWTSRSIRKGLAISCYLPVAERMQAQKFSQYFSFLYLEGLGFDKTGKLKLVKDYPGNHQDPALVIPSDEWNKWCQQQHPELTNVGTFAYYQEWASNEIAKRLMLIEKNLSRDFNQKTYWVNLLNEALKRKHSFFWDL